MEKNWTTLFFKKIYSPFISHHIYTSWSNSERNVRMRYTNKKLLGDG